VARRIVLDDEAERIDVDVASREPLSKLRAAVITVNADGPRRLCHERRNLGVRV